MGKKNNVNPDHYKTRGREKPGQDIVQEVHKQKLTQTQSEGGSQYIPGGGSAIGRTADAPPSEDTGQIVESANSSSNT